MKKKQLAAVLVLGMVCTLITTVPVCAQETKDTGAAHTIACLGDSITYGFVKDPTTGEESGTSYPMDLNILLGDDYNVVNLGKPGAYATHDDGVLSIWNQEVYQQALELDADTFIVMLGTNDSHEDTFDEQAFSADYEAIIDSLQEAHPDAAFYLMTSPCSYNNDLADEGLLHGQIYETINSVGEKKGIPVIDLHTYTHDHPEWFRDQLHPNDVGYAVLSAYIYDQIKGELEE